ncbi:MAG: hypothetical protein V5B38_10975 [Candidatus Accumulibacter propinquus]
MADMSVPAINHPAPLHALLDTQRALAQPVCHDGGRYIDWEEFRARVRQRARGVAGSGGERWLLVSESPLEFVIWLLAVLHAGKTVVVPPTRSRRPSPAWSAFSIPSPSWRRSATRRPTRR